MGARGMSAALDGAGTRVSGQKAIVTSRPQAVSEVIGISMLTTGGSAGLRYADELQGTESVRCPA